MAGDVKMGVFKNRKMHSIIIFKYMSGHSHFATIRRQKETKDAARGKVFSRHSKAIAIAIKAGGNPNPDMNARLRFAIDQAKADNMPKSNIDRILEKAAGSSNLEEITYEGFGPANTMFLVECATDNRNRTVQELKNIFEKAGGNMGGPGSVSFNFEQKGLILVSKMENVDEQMLSLIDLGVDDVLEESDSLEVYTVASQLGEIRDLLSEKGYTITSFELIQKPKNYQVIDNAEVAQKVLTFMDTLESYDDVQKVFSNIEIDESIVKALSN